MKAGIYRRLEGLIDTDALLGKTVCLVGLGSVGSSAAMWLAKSGVGGFKLIDNDCLTVENVARHLCGLSDIGRPKIEAVKDALLNRNPDLSIKTYSKDVVELTEAQRRALFAGTDLIIASTDSNLAQFTVNHISLTHDIPALYIGCYERASGGEIVYVVPGKTACFNCAFEARTKNLQPVRRRKTSLAYTTALSESQADRFEAEPGLAVDIDYVTVSAMPYALALLGPASQREFLLDFEQNIVFVSTGNRPTWIFNRPFSRIVGRAEVGCGVCRGEL